MLKCQNVRCKKICQDLPKIWAKSVEISPDLSKSTQICQDPSRSVEIWPDQSRSYEICLIMPIKLSKCQSNCHNIKSHVLSECVQINLAHRLGTNFQYFLFTLACASSKLWEFVWEGWLMEASEYKIGCFFGQRPNQPGNISQYIGSTRQVQIYRNLSDPFSGRLETFIILVFNVVLQNISQLE